jgi:hypothetical protein
MTIEELWDHLVRVRKLAFVAQSSLRTGWNGEGTGTVVVQPAGDAAITFTEFGSWLPDGGRDIRFHNVFRWSIVDGKLHLEHLRFGEASPVHLFDMEPAGDREWVSVLPHQCSEDCYTARILVHEDRIVLNWSIDGYGSARRSNTITHGNFETI